jgi:DNA-binding transcriptional ArsR family regulator
MRSASPGHGPADAAVATEARQSWSNGRGLVPLGSVELLTMSLPGKDAGRDRPLDPNLAKALTHPLRQRILERLSVGGDEVTPTQLARLLDAPLPNVAYHVRILHQLDCIELVRTRQVRGALEHYYRATAHPWFDAEQWAQLPASFRRQMLARTLRDIVCDASDAGIAGGFDHPDAQVRRTIVMLDKQGWQDVAAVLEQTLSSVQQIHDESAVRAAKGETGPPTIDTEIALLLFRGAPQSA